jgi:hypothetical protein
VAKKSIAALTALALTGGIDLLRTAVTLVACRPRAGGVVTLVDLRVGVTELDSNVALQLVLEAHSLNLRNGLHESGLSV